MKKLLSMCSLAIMLCGISFAAPKSKFASKLKSFGEKLSNAYILPASYETAYSYRTNTPYKEIVTLIKSKELDALRMSNPLKYVQQICEKITALSKNDFEKAKMAHDFVAVLVSYDAKNFWAGTVPSQEWTNVIKTKTAVCEGYSNTLKKFCDTLKIPCEIVHGYARGVGTSPLGQENPKNTNHAWNIIKLEGEHYLVDCTWDSGHMEGKISKQDYNTDWLFVKPEHCIYSHYPDMAKKQLLITPISVDEFCNLPDLRPVFFDIIREAKIPSKLESCEGIYNFELEAKDGYTISFSMQNLSKNAQTENCIFSNTVDGITKTMFSLPTTDIYEVRIFYRKSGNKLGKNCGSFAIQATEKSDVRFPIIYSHSGKNTYITEPIQMPLKAGETQHFIVHVENKKFVAVICGRDFIQLENDGNGTFAGDIEIPSNIKELSIAFSNDKMKSYESLAKYKVE